MKTNYVLSSVFLLCLNATIVAQDDELYPGSDNVRFWFTREFKVTTDDNDSYFEFKNKTKEPVFIEIMQNGEIILQKTEVYSSRGSEEKDHSYLRIKNDKLSISSPTLLKLYTGQNIQNSRLKSVCLISPNKRIYLTYGKNTIRAQTGKGGKTQSGLMLTNNTATNKDIQCAPPIKIGKHHSETTFKASSAANVIWTIEIKNKLKKSLTMTLKEGDSEYEHDMSASSGSDENDHSYVRFSGIDPRKDFKLSIKSDDGKYYHFDIPANWIRRTIFLTFEEIDDRMIVRPQEGTGFLSKKTQSELALKPNYNVKKSEIQRIQ